MKKLPIFTLAALFLASGAALADDHDWHGGHGHHHHHHHRHHDRPSYSFYYSDPAPAYYYNPAPVYYYNPPPVYRAPRYYAPAYNGYYQAPDTGIRFGFSGTWSDR